MKRQGDVLLIPVPAPLWSQREKHFSKGVKVVGSSVLAKGEATGHDHVLHGRARYYTVPEGVYAGAALGLTPGTELPQHPSSLVELLEPGVLKHQDPAGNQADHNPVALEPGWYRVALQREYSEVVRDRNWYRVND